MPLTLIRGEDAKRWPAPRYRLAFGLIPFEPIRGYVPDIWEAVKEHIRNEPRASPYGLTIHRPNAFGQTLRASGKSYAIATARSRTGAFDTLEYVYELRLPNPRAFRLRFVQGQDDWEQADEMDLQDADQEKEMWLLLDADTIQESSILALGHPAGTGEVTFFHGVDVQYVVSCNGIPRAHLGVKTQAEVTAILNSTNKDTIAEAQAIPNARKTLTRIQPLQGPAGHQAVKPKKPIVKFAQPNVPGLPASPVHDAPLVQPQKPALPKFKPLAKSQVVLPRLEPAPDYTAPGYQIVNNASNNNANNNNTNIAGNINTVSTTPANVSTASQAQPVATGRRLDPYQRHLAELKERELEAYRQKAQRAARKNG